MEGDSFYTHPFLKPNQNNSTCSYS